MSVICRTLTLSLFLLIPVSFALSFSLPQDESQKKSQVQDDLEFAVNLARYRYFDIADEFVEKIKSGKLSSKEQDTLLKTSAQILKIASEHSLDEDERLDFYNQAIQLYKEFVDYSTAHPDYNEMRMEKAEVHMNLGKFLCEKGKRSKEDDQTKKKFKEDAISAFRECVQLYNETASDLRKESEALEDIGDIESSSVKFNQARQCDYKKGMAYYFWGLAYSVGEFNREDYLNRCINSLDDYIWDSPPDDFYVLWAYLYQARSYMELGNFVDALDLAGQVYDPHTGIDLSQAVDLAPEYAKFITDLTENAFLLVAQINYRTGDYQKSIDTVDLLMTKFEEHGFELSPLGHMARLEQAKSLLAMNDAAKTEKASQICKDVADQNPDNNVGKDAEIMLKEIIEKSNVTSISPDVLMSAADGSRSEKSYYEAIRNYMKVLAASQTVQQKEKFNAQAWYCIGQCYLSLKRYLEAATAFEQGFTDPDRGSDQKIFESNAQNWYSALMRRHRETKDAFDEKRKKTAIRKLVSMGISTDLQFVIARDKFAQATAIDGEGREATMMEAMQEFRDMEKESSFYERSLIYIARCYLEIEKYEEALDQFKEFKKYVGEAAPPGTKKQRTYRLIALAQDSFWRTEAYLKLKMHKEVLKTLEGFEEKYSGQPDFVAPVIYNRILAKIGIGEFEEAESFYEGLKKEFPESNRVPLAAYYIANAAFEKAQDERGDSESAPPPNYIKFLKKSTEYMKLYCELSGYDSFTNLKNVCEWQKELGELGEEGALEKSRANYKKLLDKFGKDKVYKDEIESSVYRSYAMVLNRLHDFQTAKPIWMKLLSKNTKNPHILRNTAFCLGGWMEKDGDTYIEIPGSGDYAADPAERTAKISLTNAQEIWTYLLKGIEDRGEKYSPDWWQAKFYTTYARYRAGAEFPGYLDQAKLLITNQKIFKPELGGPEFRPMFRYLENAVDQARRKK